MTWVRALLALAVLPLPVMAWLVLGIPAVGFILGTPKNPQVAEYDTDTPSIESIGRLHYVEVAGTPEAIGYGIGHATAPWIMRTEAELHETLTNLVPGFLPRHILLGLVSLNNRVLPHFITEPEQREIYAMARGYSDAGDPHASVGPAYGRLLHYHALHDVSQYLVDNPLVNAPQIGCTAIVAGPTRSANGNLVVGRLFDFEGGRSFDNDKIIYRIEPDIGHTFLSISWGGVSGAVTGMNEMGLWVSINAGVSDEMRFNGRPLILAVRDILQHAGSIEEAVDTLSQTPVFVSESILLCHGPSKRAVVVEMGPGHMAVRPMVDDALIVTNDFRHESWKKDVANQYRKQHGTSQKRYTRAQQLLEQHEKHSPDSFLEILRNRQGIDHSDVGFANRGTINAWIGAHLVVADVTAGQLWVCEPPHGLGRAWGFDIHGPLDEEFVLPHSPDLDLQLRQHEPWLSLIDTAEQVTLTSTAANRVVALNPRHYRSWWIKALAERAQGHRREARAAAQQALDLQPAYANEADALKNLVSNLK